MRFASADHADAAALLAENEALRDKLSTTEDAMLDLALESERVKTEFGELREAMTRAVAMGDF
jgi:predicted  nucleic acid-binding Zn-ribbon protein